MQTKTSVSLIFVGVVLLYLGIFGLVAPFRLAVAGTLEDFLTYSKVDPNNHISVTSSTTIHFISYQNEIAYLYADKGVNYFGISFTHTIDVKMGATSTAASCFFWALTNDLGDIKGLKTAGKTVINARMAKATAGWYFFMIGEIYNGEEYNQGSTQADAFQADTWYYITISKVGTYFKCDIYTDSARTILKKTLALTLHANHNFRYIMPCVTYNQAAADNGPIDIANLIISGGTAPATGTIVVNAQYYDGTAWKDVPASTVTVTCDGDQKQTPATFSSLLIGSHTINLVTTSITVSGVTYPFTTWEDSSVASTRTVSVAAGETKTLISYYAKEDVKPPSEDFWKILQQTFQNPIVKSTLVLSGVLLIGIGAIGLLPKKKQVYYSNF